MSNLDIWDKAGAIDPQYIKKDTNGGYSSFSLNGYWMIKKATELWGTIGGNWGYDILIERLDEGADMWHPPSLKNDNPVSLGKVLTHTIKLKLWYPDEVGKCEVVNYGHTPYVYMTKNGVKTDGEAAKKTLTDAIKKCLSMTGIAGDVYLGEYDNAEHIEAVKIEFDIQNAENKDAEIDDKKKEAVELIENTVKVMDESKSLHELASVRKIILRDLGRKAKITGLLEISTRGIKHIEETYIKQREAIKDAQSNEESSK